MCAPSPSRRHAQEYTHTETLHRLDKLCMDNPQIQLRKCLSIQQKGTLSPYCAREKTHLMPKHRNRGNWNALIIAITAEKTVDAVGKSIGRVSTHHGVKLGICLMDFLRRSVCFGVAELAETAVASQACVVRGGRRSSRYPLAAVGARTRQGRDPAWRPRLGQSPEAFPVDPLYQGHSHQQHGTWMSASADACGTSRTRHAQASLNAEACANNLRQNQ